LRPPGSQGPNQVYLSAGAAFYTRSLEVMVGIQVTLEELGLSVPA
jgi:hypothetical protein